MHCGTVAPCPLGLGGPARYLPLFCPFRVLLYAVRIRWHLSRVLLEDTWKSGRLEMTVVCQLSLPALAVSMRRQLHTGRRNLISSVLAALTRAATVQRATPRRPDDPICAMYYMMPQPARSQLARYVYSPVQVFPSRSPSPRAIPTVSYTSLAHSTATSSSK